MIIKQISVSRLYDFIDATIEIDEVNNDKLDLKFTVIESDKFFVNRIDIFGNNITEEKVIRNQLEVDEGDPFNKLLHAKSINNLKALRIFGDVKDEIISIDNSQQKNIKITVEEKPTGEILASAGVGNDGGTIGFSVSEKNFMGRGIGLVSSLSLSEEKVKGEFTVNNPNFNYTEKSLSTSFFAINNDKMEDSGYDSSEAGFSFGTKFEQYDNLFFSPSFKTVAEKLETNSLASNSIKKQEGNYFTSNIGYAFDYDVRNQRFQTSDGFRSQFFQTLPLISESNTITSGYVYDHYLTISETTASVGLFLKNTTGLSDDVRISERIGLPRKRLRGFKPGRIGPVDQGDDHVGGNYAAALSFTSNLPMVAPNLQNFEFNYFLDFGNVWGTDYRSSDFDDSNYLRVSTGAEIKIMKDLVIRVAKKVQDENKIKIDFLVGTMIELPRAAIKAKDIAKHAEFFSFGTNDLTQTTFGISRDDSGKFLNDYIENKIFDIDPFVSIDDGVGDLIKIATDKGRKQNKKIKLGICGEHGGDPKSIEFCAKTGLDYVSCSPYRVPVARLAAAQAQIKKN